MLPDEKTTMIELLREFKDVFAWSYKDMRGSDPKLYQHQIHLSKDAQTVAQRRYPMNSNYVLKVKEEIGKLLQVGFIRPVKQNGKIQVDLHHTQKEWENLGLVDYQKLNSATITNAFSLPFTDGVLDVVAGHEVYSFLDEYNGYNHIRMHPDDQEKTIFVMKWGVFCCRSNDV